MFKKLTQIITLSLVILMMATPALADAVVGDEIISLGADLTVDQKNSILNELDASNAEIIEVTNAEEHKYLGGIISSEKIGNIAISSAKLTILNDGKGVDVDVSDNITYITEEIYRNALITAGIEDAEVKVTAPFKVTGTGALTGIMKAYETLTGESISDEVKKVANEELVITTELSQQIGDIDTSKIVNDIKIAFSENMPETEEEARTIIVNVSNNYNVNLTDSQVNQLVGLFMKMKNANVDWDKVAKTAQKYSQDAVDYLATEDGQSFLQSIKVFFNSLIDWISNLFK
ncbi:MAG: DUF1002 domain-containing protein [Tissierellia bacterium]|nr:DUF1002 domain-containing protein [Tissierellia bacterium]